MWEDLPTPAALTIAHTIQLVMAPVFLLTGLGSLLNLFAGRLARVVDRSRDIERRFDDLTGAERDRAVWELRLLDKRMALISGSITLCTLSSVAIGLVVAGLFVARLIGGGFGRTTAILFIAAMAFLVLALAMFLIEIRVANRSIRIRNELLERDRRGRRLRP
jgi:MFS family permease